MRLTNIFRRHFTLNETHWTVAETTRVREAGKEQSLWDWCWKAVHEEIRVTQARVYSIRDLHRSTSQWKVQVRVVKKKESVEELIQRVPEWCLCSRSSFDPKPRSTDRKLSRMVEFYCPSCISWRKLIHFYTIDSLFLVLYFDFLRHSAHTKTHNGSLTLSLNMRATVHFGLLPL